MTTNMKINISDAWKDIDSVKINIGDVWKDITETKINIGDSWKTVFTVSGTGSKIIDYGFETCTGYIFTTDHTANHANGTEVVSSGDSDCGSRNAHSGSKYLHREFYIGTLNACIGTTPSSVSASCNIGSNSTFIDAFCPGGSKDTTNLVNDISSNTLVTRFYFRTTGSWKGGSLGMLKFVRLYGNGTGGDNDAKSVFVHIDPNSSGGTAWRIYTSGSGWAYFNNAPNINDGNWHSICVKHVRLNDIEEDPNVTIEVWWDNWSMTGDPDGSELQGYAPDFNNKFHHIVLQSNFSATYPSSAMGIDLDDIEVWDGEP